MYNTVPVSNYSVFLPVHLACVFVGTVGCATPDECMAACQNPAGCSNIAYPKLVLELLPAGKLNHSLNLYAAGA